MRTAVTTVLMLVCALATAPAYASSCRHIDDDTKRAMSGWQVPGLALGVVGNGKPIYTRTFGTADIGTAAPITDRTLFGIGSIAKSMTALGFAISDTQKEMPLTTPIRAALPDFPTGITIRHLLSHMAGWPRHDALWYLNVYDGSTLPKKLARLPRFAAPGAAFQYNNVPFAAVGAFVAEKTGTSWESWIRGAILQPAGMTAAITRFSDFRDSQARAMPYFPAREGRIALPLRDTDPVAPAAGVYAGLRDMMRYLSALATGGVIDGQRIFPAAAIRHLMTATSRGYGLGLRVGTWRGERLAFHPGFIDGYGARISVLPDAQSGVIVLTNMSGETPVARIVSQIALDCLTDAPRTDWIARFGGKRQAPNPLPVAPATAQQDRAPETYAGTYAHPAYGAVSFVANPKIAGLSGHFHGRDFELAYAGNDAWRLAETHWPLREGLIFSFGGHRGETFGKVSAPLADGPTYRHNAGPLIFRRIPLSSPVPSPD